MVTISVPITSKQEKFIKELVKSGRAANKAHAVRLAVDAFEEDEMFASLQRSVADAQAGRVYYGDLDVIAKKLRA